MYNLSMLLAIMMFITVFVVIGIMAIISWLFDYHDIGILYANGFIGKDIKRVILHENILKLVVPLILSSLYAVFLSQGFGANSIYIIGIYYIIVLIYFLEMIFCSNISYHLLRYYNPIKLLGGEII